MSCITSNRNIEPHQLDFDWRFDLASRGLLGECAADDENVLLLGCPSLVETLESQKHKGLLLERNPIHLGTSKFKVQYSDLRYFDTRAIINAEYDLAILDAPWYPADLCNWINLALGLVRDRASIIFVLWPESTRPSAKIEHAQIKASLDSVGLLTRVGSISYEMPLFEKESIETIGPSIGQR